MSLEDPTRTPEKTRLESQIDDILAYPEQYRFQDNVHAWPNDPMFDRLPEKCFFTYKDGSRYFVVVRSVGKYLSLPIQMLFDTIEGMENLDELKNAGFTQLNAIDLPTYDIIGQGTEALAETLRNLRPE